MTRAIVLAAALLLPAAVLAGGVAFEMRQIHAETPEYKVDAEYPVTGIAAIDAPLAAWVEDTVATFKDGAQPDPDSAAGAWTLDITPSVQRNDGEVLALLFAVTDYTGGAHGGLNFRSFNYRLPAGTPITFDEIVRDEQALKALSRLVVADLVRKLDAAGDDVLRQWIEEGAGPDRKNFEVFLLHEDALEIVFPPYQVASWADGTQQVMIPLQALSATRGDASSAAAPSFDCARAATPVERAICADADLAALDRELDARFRAKLDDASFLERRSLRRRQRDWLKQRDAACGEHAGAGLVACLAERYRERLDEPDSPR